MTLYLPEHRRTTAVEITPVRERPAPVWPRGLVAIAICVGNISIPIMVLLGVIQ